MTGPRAGIGYDIHRLAADRRLVLGGVAIEHPTGLAGHSDGDVLLHALMDALLGAANLGDLGRHFPSDDPAFAGASSLGLLKRVGALIREAGFAVASLDATVIAQAPRIAPHVHCYVPLFENQALTRVLTATAAATAATAIT